MSTPLYLEHLLTIEQAYAELAEQQARLQFEWLKIQQQQGEGRSQVEKVSSVANQEQLDPLK